MTCKCGCEGKIHDPKKPIVERFVTKDEQSSGVVDESERFGYDDPDQLDFVVQGNGKTEE